MDSPSQQQTAETPPLSLGGRRGLGLGGSRVGLRGYFARFRGGCVAYKQNHAFSEWMDGCIGNGINVHRIRQLSAGCYREPT